MPMSESDKKDSAIAMLTAKLQREGGVLTYAECENVYGSEVMVSAYERGAYRIVNLVSKDKTNRRPNIRVRGVCLPTWDNTEPAWLKSTADRLAGGR